MMTYILFMLPGLALALFATVYTRSMFAKYARVQATSRVTGAEAAARLLLGTD